MHRLPALDWKTWLRLALIPAGKDWRALREMDCNALRLVSLGEHASKMRVEPWNEPCHTVTGSDRVGSGALSVADPRFSEGQAPQWRGDVLGVRPWDEPSGTITGRANPTTGVFSVADPRVLEGCTRDNQQYGVRPWEEPPGTVTGQSAPGGGCFSVADPRIMEGRFNNVYRVVRWNEPSACITAGGGPTAGGLSVADPREAWAGAGHYGVMPWTATAGAVTGSAGPDNGRNSVADPRRYNSPHIISLDGTRHRPLTTLDLAALQGFPTRGLVLDGKSTAKWREHIGNAVPPPAAKGIASVMGHVLLLAHTGTTMDITDTPIWVRPLATALAVQPAELDS
jgi:site-specific DNA-cytosine methylase